MLMTWEQKQARMVEDRAKFEDIAELQRTQPALYQALCAFGTANQAGNTEAAFDAAGEIAGRVLALAAGLQYVD